jgi:hypothetical protein
MNTWPFPPPGGPVPWTPQQQRAYERQRLADAPDAPFLTQEQPQ